MPQVAPIELTQDSFEARVLRSEMPVLVDFYGSLCAPCKALAPTIDELARDYAGRAVVAKLNVEDHPMTGVEFGVGGLPTVLVFKDGFVVSRMTGMRSKSDFVVALDRAIAG